MRVVSASWTRDNMTMFIVNGDAGHQTYFKRTDQSRTGT